MDIDKNTSDQAALNELGQRLARHRLDRNLTQAALAEEAGVSKRTLLRIEAGESTQLANLIRVLRALGLLEALNAAIPQPVPSPIEQLRSQNAERRRATPQAKPAADDTPWSWGKEEGDA
jgi:hypothetical protein